MKASHDQASRWLWKIKEISGSERDASLESNRERVAGCPSVSTRDVIRILLERNLSRGIARCADSLISRVRGDKYRRDTSPKQTAYA